MTKKDVEALTKVFYVRFVDQLKLPNENIIFLESY